MGRKDIISGYLNVLRLTLPASGIFSVMGGVNGPSSTVLAAIENLYV